MEIGYGLLEIGYGLWAMGYWRGAIGDRLEARQLTVDSSYLAFARTITRRARVRQLTIDSWQGGYINNIIQQLLRSHNATSAEEGRTIDS